MIFEEAAETSLEIVSPKKESNLSAPVNFLKIINNLFASQYHLPLDKFLKGLVETFKLEGAAVYYNHLDYRWQLVATLASQYVPSVKKERFPDIIEYQEAWPAIETSLSEGERVMLTEEEVEALGFFDTHKHHVFCFPLLEGKWWSGLLIVDFGARKPSSEELIILDEMAETLSLAIKRQKREREYLDVSRVFQELLNNIPYLVILADFQGRWLLTNKKCLQFFNLKRGLPSQTFEHLKQIRPQYQEVLDRFQKLIKNLSDQGSPVKEIFKLKTNDRIQWWEFLLIPFKCDSEKRILILGRDITSFKAAQERLLTILENLPAMVYIVHPETHTILYHNSLFKEFFGRSFINQRPCYKLLFGKNKVCEFCSLKNPVLGHREQREIFDEEHNCWLRIHEVYIHWLDKDLVRLGMIEDITEIKQQKERVIKAQKAEVVSKMSATIAHEFNNILAVITGYLDLIKLKAQENPKIIEYAEKILQAVESGSSLIKQFLILSGKSADIDSKDRRYDLNLFIKEQQELFQKLLGENIYLKIDLCEVPLNVDLSRDELQHILTNLLLNAKEAMSEGGEIFITTKKVETSRGPAALLRVKDSGIGIAKKDLAHIFEPFYTTKPSGRGTGLGLNVVLSLIHRCGGEIKVESEPGEGTTFELILPLSMNIETVCLTGEKDHLSEKEKRGPVVSKKTILVVEDEAHIREMLVEMLAHQDFEVIPAENGEDALNKIKQRDYKVDLIITDVVMPKMDGVRLYREVQKIIPEVPVIFISGYAEHILERYGFDEKSFRIIKKPFTFKELLDEVDKVFNRLSL
ncbi:PAS/PAC sensor hybrid histidine kinase [Thermodesulfatator indicus DSM 15286]|uniref:histidine kinase n=2 Tax=Thermodesulfatator indicus TaxID=171695 RepID=F8AA25_THEID|nr:PAS/PAC sensor hybrid histidine kinase [Thermodesulfatator indicus DSM 15286]